MPQYEDEIRKLQTLNLDSIIDISRKFVPEQYKNCPWKIPNLNHGTAILTTNEQLCCYMAAYGEMHKIKCRTAIQNFPFKEISFNVEIVDWGCGQGLATMCLIDVLKERDLFNRLKKITLIEPSTLAIQRALLNVTKVTEQKVKIVSINKHMPGYLDEDNTIMDIKFECNTTIHLFSNILDITSINLSKLSQMVSSSGSQHFILCMGPTNANANRIDDFCSFFHPENYFSNVENLLFGYITNTHHSYSCKIKCFQFNLNKFELNLDSAIVSKQYEKDGDYDDYDPLLVERSGLITQDTLDLYKLFYEQKSENDSIFIRPDINGDRPDLVIVRPNIGILIINVFDKDINEYSFTKSEKGQTPIMTDKNKNEVRSPLMIVKTYKQNIINLHVNTILEHSLENQKYWGVIHTLIYFSKNNTSNIQSCFAKEKYIGLYGNDFFKGEVKNIFNKIGFNYQNHLFTDEICQSFINLIVQQWHSYTEGKRMKLTSEQIELSRSEIRPRRKIKGVAGSGKTQVLANRAVNAQLRTGKKILILTFNITLINYIRYRIGEVREDFAWSDFYIVNYHQFIKQEANNYGIKLGLDSFNNMELFESVKNSICRYQTILIDEIQDYKTEWLEIITEYFLERDGEFVVFGDAKQNIYHRKLDEKSEIRTIGIPGDWNKSLNRGFRFSNVKLTELAIAFQKEFFPKLECDNVLSEPTFDFQQSNVKYAKVENSVSIKKLTQWCVDIMKNFSVEAKDCVVLSETCDILRDIDFAYRQQTKLETITTFETKEQYESLKSKYNINSRFKNDIDNIRQNKKLHFTMDSLCLKLSTIYSYKGWESSTVILIILPIGDSSESYGICPDEDVSELIYTAITRAKKNLFIINIGNEKYDKFFQLNKNKFQ